MAQVLLDYMAFQSKDPTRQAAVGLLSGWPATASLLIVSYLFGTWRLARLGGPSVAEFQAQARPPWIGQRRGF